MSVRWCFSTVWLIFLDCLFRLGLGSIYDLIYLFLLLDVFLIERYCTSVIAIQSHNFKQPKISMIEKTQKVDDDSMSPQNEEYESGKENERK